MWDVLRENLSHPLPRLLVQIVAVIAVARVFGAIARRLGQPSVIGEMAAGIALGPSLMGALAPGAFAQLFPPASLGTLQLLSQLGVILFMFIVGLDFSWQHVRHRAHVAVVISNVSIVIPFALGALAALALYKDHAPAGIPLQAFALFMGIAMSITAFPVLARILAERNMADTPVGAMALTCAAVGDVTAWILLAFVVAVVSAGGSLANVVTMVAMTAGFVAAMILVIRPILGPFFRTRPGQDAFSRERIAVAVGAALASALTTEVIGIHALFGAFVAGATLPAGDDFRAGLRDRLESFSSVLLLPLFFAFTGLRTQIGLIDSWSAVFLCLAMIALATVGKLGGGALAARVMGMNWKDSFILGALMNTRGLMELIALNVGYDLGVISPQMFTVLVVMALVTTAMTGPLVDLVKRRLSS
jgi:Kef-type K+ transport system membrane component KefB